MGIADSRIDSPTVIPKLVPKIAIVGKTNKLPAWAPSYIGTLPTWAISKFYVGNLSCTDI